MEKENIIKCPECGANIDVNEILYHNLEDQIKKDYEKKSAKKEKELQSKLEEIETEKEKIKVEREKLSELINKEVQSKITTEKNKLEKLIRQQIDGEKSGQLKMLENELNQKSEQIKDLNRTKAEVERLKREKEELKDQITLEKEKELTKIIGEEKLKIKKQVEDENYLKIKELEKQLGDQKKLAEEMKRKAEQGSIQLQGEVQELEIENILRSLYPVDEITEIKKGQRGADILQTVRTNEGLTCGKIYYESKRTKDFQHSWLQKLKDDNLTIKADILVLVSEVLPGDTEQFSCKDGIWICSFKEIKGLSLVLRYGLLQVHNVTITQQDKGTKMELLYNYLTSQEFRGQLEAILGGFKSLQDSYSDEKLKMQKIWKEREKQLEKILTNTVNFYGSLKGIAGASIPQIEMLESVETPRLIEKKE